MRLRRPARLLLALAATAATAQAQTPPSPAACHTRQVTTLPGSHLFASDFIEAVTTEPGSPAPDPAASAPLYALTADLNTQLPPPRRALYISRSTNDGATWTLIARIAPRYFNARIAEGLRNALVLTPNPSGTNDFVLTTQLGAFQVIPQPDPDHPTVIPIPGPRVPAHPPADITLTKKPGDPVRAGVALITADGRRLILAYGYFDDNPQLLTYRRNRRGTWVPDGALPRLPTDLDVFSMQFDDPANPSPASLYVGTGDQAYLLNFRTGQYSRVTGVGPDSAIHSISTVGGPHFAACWGVYTPLTADSVRRVTTARFLLHRNKDEVGPNIRAYGITVDPLRPDREVLTAITGVYTTSDGGDTWRRVNDLPEGEYHTAHINPDGSILVSGYLGTFLTDPFSNTCAPQLKSRDH